MNFTIRTICLPVLFFLISCAENREKENTYTDNNNYTHNSKDSNSKQEEVTVFQIDTTVTMPQITTVQNEIITPGGIKITFIEKSNSNEKIKKGDVIKIKYNAYLPDGKLFDSSDMIGMALGYYVGIGMSVKGWDEALPYTSVGDKFRLHIPAKLAYGKKGYGKLIPPDTDLDFDMEITEKMTPEVLQNNLQFYLTLPKAAEKKVAQEGNDVTIHYYAWTADGRLFDATHFNGKPYKYKLGFGKAIEAWNIALKKMRKGEKAIVVVPPQLGYGEAGIPELVPPNATLVYMLELIDVK